MRERMVTYSLLGKESLEAPEVGKVVLGLSVGMLLGPCGGSPLLNDTSLGDGLGDGLLSGINGNRDSEVGEGNTAKVDHLTGNAGGGSVDEDSVLIEDVDDHSDLAIVSSILNEDNSSDLNETLEKLKEEKRIR
jgi:hypothetical protein